MRSIVRELLFEDSLAALVADPIAADKFIEAADWVLASANAEPAV